MSKVVHRKPVWGWSVVLFSTLLLSPVAAAALLHALGHVANHGDVTTTRTDPTNQSPRRTGKEDALLRSRGEQPRTLRFDTDPDAVAILFSQRAVQRVLDDAPLAHKHAPRQATCSGSCTATDSRAPPS